MNKQVTLNDPKYWYKDAIIYELHIKAFFDSNGDGIGDFKGLIEKLDYLEDLGVTAIWLLPFYPSPLRDDGYDISDYYSINPSYGQLRDLKRFIKEAHKRGLKVITELVINHTSDQHPWFQRARKAPPGSEYRDYYVWSEDPNKYKDVRIIFTDTEPSNWSWDAEANAYYWHRFFSHQPDLNFDNPKVQDEVIRIMDYWCKIGVDGFRLDAIPYLFEREGTNCENLPETHVFLKKLRAHIDKNHDNKLFLAEANMWPEDSVSYFGDGDECHMNYHFPIMPRMFMALKMEDRYPIIDIIDQTPDIPESCQWALFLRNHDELTLEMVTDEERDYMYKVYTKDPQARINVGIRHRLAPLLENNRNKIELMNVLLFSLPGTPVIYYGDEIGMGDNFYLGDRDGVRTPMQWTADRNAGFSTANPHKLYLPVIIDPEYTFESVNVEAQQMNGSSLLWWMKRIIAMRKKFRAFGRGSIRFLSPANAKVIAFIRSYGEEEILVLGNLSRFSQAAEIDLSEYAGYHPVEAFSRNSFPEIGEVPYLFSLGPYGYYWFSLEREQQREQQTALPSLKIKQWEELHSRKQQKLLENDVFPRYLKASTWFLGKSRTLQGVTLLHWIAYPLKGFSCGIALLECTYNDGLPERYQVPLAWIPKPEEGEVLETPETAILSDLNKNGLEGYLVDAFFLDAWQRSLVRKLSGNRTLDTQGGKLHFNSGRKPLEGQAAELQPKIVWDPSHSALEFGDRYYLKLYRKLDDTINPDLEISRFLSEKTSFEQVPAFRGSVTFRKGEQTELALGLLQEKVAYQESGWDYARDAFRRYMEEARTHLSGESTLQPKGLATSPITYEEMPQVLQEVMESAFPQRMILLGGITANLHASLLSGPASAGFGSEPFSLHYQRSVFSSFQGLTRSALDHLKKCLPELTGKLRDDARETLGMKSSILGRFKKIYAHKIDAQKIRTHGDFHLEQVLWTGKDFIIRNFEGEPMRPYSERRLRRSPLRDVAFMIRSLSYVSIGTLITENNGDGEIPQEEIHLASLWSYYSARLFLQGYLESEKIQGLVPQKQEDFQMLLEIFMLEKAMYELLYEMESRRSLTALPLMGIRDILNWGVE